MKAEDVRKCLHDALQVRRSPAYTEGSLYPTCKERHPWSTEVDLCVADQYRYTFMRWPHFVLVGPGSTGNTCPASAQVGAAVLGVPVKPTIKEVDGEGRVTKTLIRAGLWEVQTPQVRHRGSLISI